MTETDKQNFYCSELALERDEQLFGTATRATTWLLLSYSAPFGRKAFDEANIPAQVKEHLSAAARGIPNSRIQLIRQSHHEAEALVFYIALVKEAHPVLYRFNLNTYEDLLAIDVRAVAEGAPHSSGHIEEEPVFLVCTHGTHDRCCARFGVPVYTQMSAHTEIHAWQTSHLGGHRFATNVLCLPHGVMYGRVTPPDVTPLIAKTMGRSIVLDKYRGRTCYDALEQAAEYFARKQAQLTGLHALRHLQTEQLSDAEARVTFLSTTDGRRHEVHIARDIGALKTFTSCGATHESSVDQFRLLGYQVLAD